MSLIATAGLHGSGSTWAFNIARELAGFAAGGDAPISGYADTIAELPPGARDAGRWRVLKSHHGSEALDRWLELGAARYLLTIRDPRDAALSMRRRFGMTLQAAVQIVFNDCRRIAALRGRPNCCVLRYETGFFRSAAAVGMIASWMGLAIDEAACAALAARYTPEATRAFAARLDALPAERLGDRGVPGSAFDRLTHIHGVHIGDLRTGKWRDLPPGLQGDITLVFRPFLDAFGYWQSEAATV